MHASQEADDNRALWENEVKSRSKLGLRVSDSVYEQITNPSIFYVTNNRRLMACTGKLAGVSYRQSQGTVMSYSVHASTL